MSPKSSSSEAASAAATYYLVPNLRAIDSSAREVDLSAHSWVRPIVIEDEDLTFEASRSARCTRRSADAKARAAAASPATVAMRISMRRSDVGANVSADTTARPRLTITNELYSSSSPLAPSCVHTPPPSPHLSRYPIDRCFASAYPHRAAMHHHPNLPPS
ncbi:hypothetical protein NLG97_g2213 [Lecanicillium saksenae]|uniref:Uncharacterized protein n=1 Tax=Lecanicillium saksenae TaxID=468837 RepID=A0ACC1R1L9_9HYPO|nr:hypothetical protein NLG97_g2213 [Lecanicillium saksenae]